MLLTPTSIYRII